MMIETRVKAVCVEAGLLLSAAVVGLFRHNRVESEFGQGTMLASLQSRLEAAAAVPPRAFRSLVATISSVLGSMPVASCACVLFRPGDC